MEKMYRLVNLISAPALSAWLLCDSSMVLGHPDVPKTIKHGHFGRNNPGNLRRDCVQW
jgi:hypothetical protein